MSSTTLLRDATTHQLPAARSLIASTPAKNKREKVLHNHTGGALPSSFKNNMQLTTTTTIITVLPTSTNLLLLSTSALRKKKSYRLNSANRLCASQNCSCYKNPLGYVRHVNNNSLIDFYIAIVVNSLCVFSVLFLKNYTRYSFYIFFFFVYNAGFCNS